MLLSAHCGSPEARPTDAGRGDVRREGEAPAEPSWVQTSGSSGQGRTRPTISQRLGSGITDSSTRRGRARDEDEHETRTSTRRGRARERLIKEAKLFSGKSSQKNKILNDRSRYHRLPLSTPRKFCHEKIVRTSAGKKERSRLSRGQKAANEAKFGDRPAIQRL